jgi:hypothetical protein
VRVQHRAPTASPRYICEGSLYFSTATISDAHAEHGARRAAEVMNMRMLAVISQGLLLVGCAASSHVLVGTARPPISPDQVKIYLHPPAKYEEVAIIDASSRGGAPSFTDQQKMNKTIARLKAEAANLGANGVLLEGAGEQQSGSVGTGLGTATATGNSAVGTGIGISAGIFIKSANGLAIYVPPE